MTTRSSPGRRPHARGWPAELVRFIWRANPRDMLACSALELAINVLPLAGVAVLGRAIATPGAPRQLWLPCMILAAVAAAHGVLQAQRESLRVSVDHAAGRELLRVEAGVMLDVFETTGFQEDVQRARDARSRAYFLTAGLQAVVIGFLGLAAIVALIVGHDLAVGLAAVSAAPLVLLVAHRRARAFRRYSEASAPHSREVAAAESVTAQRVNALELRVRHGAVPYLTAFHVRNADAVEAVARRFVAGQWREALGAFALIGLGLGATIATFEVRVASGGLSGRETATVAALLTVAALRAISLGGLAGSLQETLDAWRELIALRAYTPTLLAPGSAAGRPAGPAIDRSQGLRATDVSVSCPNRHGPVLEGVCLDVAPGQVVAVVGPNGAGKSTLLRALCGERRPDAGLVTVGGVDLYGADGAAARWDIRCLPQHFVRFPGTVASNIAVRLEPDRDTVAKAARDSGAAEFVRGLDGAYEATLGIAAGGTELSGGQWQRLALARQLCGERPAVVLLDEPTAALDARVRGDLVERLREVLPGTAVIVCTHDPAIALRVDRAYVLEKGRIVEHGAPHELLARGGAFAELIAPASDR